MRYMLDQTNQQGYAEVKPSMNHWKDIDASLPAFRLPTDVHCTMFNSDIDSNV